EEPDRQTLGMRDGWIAGVYVYKPLSSGESFEQMASYSFWSNDSIIELLIENSCRIRISDVDFLERLADLSRASRTPGLGYAARPVACCSSCRRSYSAGER